MATDEEIESAIVNAVYSGELETATVSTVRSQAEKDVGLDPGFLKSESWKARSRNLIVETFGKRQEVQPVEKKKEVKKTQKEQAVNALDPDTDSDLSDDIIDDGPPPKKRKSTSKAVSKKELSKKTAEKKEVPAKKTAKATSKKSDEIAKLKSHLLQCGIRKQWAKLLDKMDSDTERIKYLREQLEDVGMTGRFSLAKAKQIKQKREYEQEMKDLAGDAERILKSTPPKRPTATRQKRTLVVQSDSESEDSQGHNSSGPEDGDDEDDN